MSLRSKLLIGTIVVQLTVLAVLLLVAQRVIRNALEADVAGSAVLTEQLLGAALAPLVVTKDFEALRQSTDETVRASGLVYLQVDGPDGRGLARSGAAPAREPPARSNPHAPRPASYEGVYHFGAPIRLAGQDYGRFYFGLTAAGAARERDLLLRLAAIGAAGLAASLALQWLLAGVLTRRLATVARAAEQVGAGRFDIALPVAGRDEAGAMAAALRRMSAALAERLQKLQDSEQRQRSLIETMAEGMLLQDANLRVLQCNDAALRILGLEREALEALAATDARWHAVTRDGQPLRPDRHPPAVALRTGQPQRNVVIGVEQRDGRRIWLSVNAEPLLREASSRPYATVTTFADITALIEAEDRLLRLNAELERRVSERTADLTRALELASRASRAKTEFLSRMSHDLRTPLNAILGFTQILRLGGATLSPQEREQKLAHIESAGWHLLELINDVLDLARIESGSLVVSSEPVALAPLAAECAQMLQPQAEAMSVQIVDRSAATAGLQARADRTRLKQVLTNLLSNAIKYNRRGGRVTLAARAATHDAVELSVADTGRGFTEAQQRELYQPFNRLGAEGSAVEGTGIGLVIAHRLTALMGGSLTLATEAGRGSVFTLRLPRADAPAAAADAGAGVAELTDAAARTVLYIEDNPSNVELLRGVLSLRPQWRLLTAGDGAAGLACAHEHRPDLIVIDIGLPGIDGYQVCARLRADADFAERPIVALSANAMAADIERGLAAGFDAYLTKPLSVADFLAQVDRLLAAAPRR